MIATNGAQWFLELCYKIARQKGFADYAEDFGQEAFIKIAEGRKTSLENLFIDYLRKHRGDKRNGSYDARINANVYAKDIHTPEFDQPNESADTDAIGVRLDSRRCDQRIRANLNLRERIIYDMVMSGHEGDEIGDYLGVTPSRISQRLRSIKTKRSLLTDIFDAHERYQLEPEYSKLPVEWIAI